MTRQLWRFDAVRPSQRTLHPQRAEVPVALGCVLVEHTDFVEPHSAMQPDGRLIRQGDPGDGAVNVLMFQLGEQPPI